MHQDDKLDKILKAILFELQSAEDKHPCWPDNIIEANSIIQEEAGEITKAVNQFYWDEKSILYVNEEVVQTAAMCIRFLLHGEVYDTRSQSQKEDRYYIEKV